MKRRSALPATVVLARLAKRWPMVRCCWWMSPISASTRGFEKLALIQVSSWYISVCAWWAEATSAAVSRRCAARCCTITSSDWFWRTIA